MCKEMPVIPVKEVVDTKRITGKHWRAEEEEEEKGTGVDPHSPPPQKKKGKKLLDLSRWSRSW
jgi:hypothetical protein